MSDLSGFNANNVEPTRGFEPVPAGSYVAIITASQTKQTKRGDGEYLELTLQIGEGPLRNRRIWKRLNLKNRNATAVEIARAELSAICRAVDVMQPSDSSELHNIPLSITVTLKKREDNGEMTNEIKSYAKIGGTAFPASEVDEDTPPW